MFGNRMNGAHAYHVCSVGEISRNANSVAQVILHDIAPKQKLASINYKDPPPPAPPPYRHSKKFNQSPR